MAHPDGDDVAHRHQFARMPDPLLAHLGDVHQAVFMQADVDESGFKQF